MHCSTTLSWAWPLLPAHLHVDAAGETVLLHKPLVPPHHQAVHRVGLCAAQQLNSPVLRQLQGWGG